MAENNENKIRRRKVSSTNLKNTNNNRNTIKNSNKMLDIADKQLYNSKYAGRDNVTLFNFDSSCYYINLKNEIALSGTEK